MYFIHLAHYMLFLKSWRFHKCEAEREEKVVKFVFNLMIEVSAERCLSRRMQRTISKHPTGPKEWDALSGHGEGEWESCCYRQYYSPKCNHWTIN
jgi:hypothetical protein